MNFDRLRELFLDQAIRGELVSQQAEEGVVEQIGATPEEVPFKIPESWKWVQLKSIGQIIGGGTPKTSVADYWNGDISWITPADLGKNTSKWILKGAKSITQKGLDESSAKLMPEGSVVYSSRAPIGHIAIAAHELCTNQGCKSFAPDTQFITTEWAYYMLIARTRDIQSRASGTTFKEISGKGIGETWVSLPPQAEQKRIVTRLEKVFAEIARAEKAYEELQTLAGVLRGQILQEAIQGKLVPQLAEEGVVEQIGVAPDEVPFEIPESWKWCHMKGITQKIHYGFTASAANAGNAKLLRITDIQDGRVNWDTVPFCDVPEKKLASCKLGESDVVIARTGGTIGKSFLLTDVSDVAVFASYLIRLIPCAEVVNPKYLMVFLNSPEYWKQLKAMSQGTGQPNVNAKSLSTLLLPLPPLDEQARIVAKVEELLKHVDALSAK